MDETKGIAKHKSIVVLFWKRSIGLKLCFS